MLEKLDFIQIPELTEKLINSNQGVSRLDEILSIHPGLFQPLCKQLVYKLSQDITNGEDDSEESSSLMTETNFSLFDQFQNQEVAFVQGTFRKRKNKASFLMDQNYDKFIDVILKHARTSRLLDFLTSCLLKSNFEWCSQASYKIWPGLGSIEVPFYLEKNTIIWNKLMRFGETSGYSTQFQFFKKLIEHKCDNFVIDCDKLRNMRNNFGHILRALLCNCMSHWKNTPRHLKAYRNNEDLLYLAVSKEIIKLVCCRSRQYAPGYYLLWIEKLEYLDSFELYSAFNDLYCRNLVFFNIFKIIFGYRNFKSCSTKRSKIKNE